MRLLADESLRLESVRALAMQGTMCFRPRTAPGATDAMLLARAHTEGRLVVTFDPGFGELAARRGHGAAGGILLLRTVPKSAKEVTAILIELLARSGVVWAGRLRVLDRVHPRQRLCSVGSIAVVPRTARPNAFDPVVSTDQYYRVGSLFQVVSAVSMRLSRNAGPRQFRVALVDCVIQPHSLRPPARGPRDRGVEAP